MPLERPKYNLKAFPQVYEPNEDTFVFIDALEKEETFLNGLKPVFIAEIGSGSGLVITSLATLLQLKTRCIYFTTDINPEACLATLHTSNLNNQTINCVNMDLLNCFKDNLFDVLLFNPPYGVTESHEITGYGLSRACAGGVNGREVMDRVLKILDQLLTKQGVCYMVVTEHNDIDDVRACVRDKFTLDIVLERRNPRNPKEYLFVVKFTRNK